MHAGTNDDLTVSHSCSTRSCGCGGGLGTQRVTDDAISDSRVLLTAEQYQAMGQMKGILNKHADETLRSAAGTNGEYLPIAEALFRRLSGTGRTGTVSSVSGHVC